ncbi:hypothetical protein L21SP2_3346 [Salinispira pacifica]|uniref:Uncharacterized protein n=1 Tax=Salinispira pacifica TaxID=1307761 RepID=V5WN92_9SPIO|nr:hypothetical protein L21SP2_3346 [Salinispira pacifica]
MYLHQGKSFGRFTPVKMLERLKKDDKLISKGKQYEYTMEITGRVSGAIL